MRSLVERLPSITYRAGPRRPGHWEFVSPQVEEILGYTVEEWTSDPQCWEQAIHPDDLERVLAEEDRCAERTARSTSSTGSGRGTAG